MLYEDYILQAFHNAANFISEKLRDVYKYTVWCIFKLASYKRTHTEMTPRRVVGSSWVFLSRAPQNSCKNRSKMPLNLVQLSQKIQKLLKIRVYYLEDLLKVHKSTR